ncbi:hypothetical protein GQ44DRAFT_666930 [Phaeosphaeriaceae sp. PMI808]|nr:hypothetical protein GQ44DRAFT_666930 [Phaeosphaeriaceae sp. PMI808]
MHSILALAGSHLSVFVDGPHGNMALLYRQKAITGLEEAFTRWPPKAEEAHVMLACSYILGTQCIYLPDGYLDMFISLRGCALISQMIQNSHMKGIFSFQPGLHSFGCELKFERFPALDQDLVHDALCSLAGFSHVLCGGREIERAFFAQLVESIRPLLVHSRRSSLQISATLDPADGRPEETIISKLRRASNALISGRNILCTWPQEDVTYLFSPANKLGAVLILHQFAIKIIVSPMATPNLALRVPIKGMIKWYERIVDSVDDDEQVKWNQYIKWPSHVLTTIRCCSNEKKLFTVGDLHDILAKDPGAFRIAD